MKNSQKIALAVVVAIVVVFVADRRMNSGGRPQPAPPPTAAMLTSARDANAEELALLAPLVKEAPLLNYTVKDIKMTPKEGLVVALAKTGAFDPDGGDADGGGCDPSQPNEARVYLTVWPAHEGSSEALVRGPYAIYSRPVNMPQTEADRLAAAFADVINANLKVPMPPALADGQKQVQ